jgi:hypothetical protein
VGTLLAFASLARLPAPKVAAALTLSGIATGLAQGWINPAALEHAALAGAIAFVAWYLSVEVLALGIVNREHVSELTDLGGSGTAGRALIVYHSLGGEFQPAVERGLAEGLRSQGWRVHMTTASRAAPVDLVGYRLLVLGAPVFAALPARPILAYLRRLGDLHGMPVLLVISGQGTTEYGVELLRHRVAEANGRVVETVEVWTERDNAEQHGVSDPAEALRRVGERLRVAA